MMFQVGKEGKGGASICGFNWKISLRIRAFEWIIIRLNVGHGPERTICHSKMKRLVISGWI